jgi:DNA adenine methylase
MPDPRLDMANADENTVPRPFIKWVGGKRQLLPELQSRFPERFSAYVEPFIGGGALLWTLEPGRYRIVLGDYNEELINLYRQVQTNPGKLLKEVAKHKNEEEYYYALRAVDRSSGYKRRSAIYRAARFLFLNKTGFNGLYRVNQKGYNNVPFGKYRTPKIADSENIMACSKHLEDVTILCGDFEGVAEHITPDAFVYLDPPYAPLSATSSFTGYTDKGFDADMQFRLKEFCDHIDRQGARFMLSNSSAPLIYDLYSEYNIEEVQAKRAINCVGSKRGNVTELIVRNYE